MNIVGFWQSHRSLRQQVTIVFTALLLRGVVGYIFLGGCDLFAFFRITDCFFKDGIGGLFPLENLFPTLPFYLWFCQFLNAYTSLPVGFCFKIVPIFFDVLLALLIYRIIQARNGRYAFAGGMFYALSPIALTVCAIHVQVESLFLFFALLAFYVRDYYVDSYKKYIFYGAIFALSFLLKAVSLMFLPFFFVPYKNIWAQIGKWKNVVFLLGAAFVSMLVACFSLIKIYRLQIGDILNFVTRFYLLIGLLGVLCIALIFYGVLLLRKQKTSNFCKYLIHQACALGGLFGLVGVCFAIFYFLGVDIALMIDSVLRYFNHGAQVLGFPYVLPETVRLILKNRFLIMSLLGVVTWFYYKGRLDVYSALMLCIASILGLLFITPTYLLWLVPFLLIDERYVFAVWYNISVMAFYLLFYSNPFSDPRISYQNILSFVPLKKYAFLVPSDFFLKKELVWVIRLLGDLVIPLSCLVFVFYLFVSLFKTRHHVPSSRMCRLEFISGSIFKNPLVILPLLFSILIVVSMCIADHVYLKESVCPTVQAKIHAYDMVFVGTEQNIAVADLSFFNFVNGDWLGSYQQSSLFNTIALLAFLSLLWSIALLVLALKSGRKDLKNPFN